MKAPAFWQSRGWASTALLPASALYALGAKLRYAGVQTLKLPVPVICVGNAVAGGAGKTPTVLAVAKLLAADGKNVFALSRGYGGSMAGPVVVKPSQHDASQVGDEPLMLARWLPTIVSRKRTLGGQLAVREGAQIIVMDDGYQNPSLHKDRHLLVIDGVQGFGNGRTLPAGCLREPAEQALARADALLIIGEASPAVQETIRPFAIPRFSATLQPKNAEDFKGQRCLAFAGIAQPDKFFRTLAACGAKLEKAIAFADHHAFSHEEFEDILKQAVALGAMAVTTRKDYVRLSPAQQAHVKILDVELVFDPQAQALLAGWLRGAAYV